MAGLRGVSDDLQKQLEEVRKEEKDRSWDPFCGKLRVCVAYNRKVLMYGWLHVAGCREYPFVASTRQTSKGQDSRMDNIERII